MKRLTALGAALLLATATLSAQAAAPVKTAGDAAKSEQAKVYARLGQGREGRRPRGVEEARPRRGLAADRGPGQGDEEDAEGRARLPWRVSPGREHGHGPQGRRDQGHALRHREDEGRAEALLREGRDDPGRRGLEGRQAELERQAGMTASAPHA